MRPAVLVALLICASGSATAAAWPTVYAGVQAAYSLAPVRCGVAPMEWHTDVLFSYNFETGANCVGFSLFGDDYCFRRADQGWTCLLNATATVSTDLWTNSGSARATLFDQTCVDARDAAWGVAPQPTVTRLACHDIVEMAAGEDCVGWRLELRIETSGANAPGVVDFAVPGEFCPS
ncbi:MAG: hypothetical protein ACYDCK_06740 [Thermoplasmatota archaeon]